MLWGWVHLWNHSISFGQSSELYTWVSQQQSRDVNVLDKAHTAVGTRNWSSPPRQMSQPLAYGVFFLLLPSKYCVGSLIRTAQCFPRKGSPPRVLQNLVRKGREAQICQDAVSQVMMLILMDGEIAEISYHRVL